MGIMNLAMLTAIGMTDMHAMNALKVVLGGFINGVATLTFIATGAIVWRQGVIMTAGGLFGGYCAAPYAQKVPQTGIPWFCVFMGTRLTIYFFLRPFSSFL